MAAEKKSLKIRWTRTAEFQLFQILEYWTEKNRSPRYADKLVKLVWERTHFLSENPFISAKSQFPKIRRSVLGPFSLYYEIQSHELIIMAFWDNRQDPKKLRKLF